MKPSKLSIFELFERKKRHVVPLYQRPYVWTQGDQWEPLWNDIRQLAENVIKDQSSSEQHFLGAIVLNQIKVYGKQIPAWEIIDGQQRMTTLQVFLAAFRDIVREHGNQDMGKDIEKLTYNDGTREDEYEVFKVWPSNFDRIAFEAVMRAGSTAELEKKYPPVFKRKKLQPRPPLVEAYLYFQEAIRKFINDDAGAVDERLNAMLETISRHVEIIEIALETGDDPQVIFETLNGRGVPLLASDLIRNFVFLRATRMKESPDALYEKYWRLLDEKADKTSNLPFWKVEERQGRLLRTRLDLFLHHYLTYQRETEINIGRLFHEFKLWWEAQDKVDGAEKPTVDQRLSELRRHSDVFETFFVQPESGRLALFAKRLRALDTSTIYPLLLYLCVDGRKKIADADFPTILGLLESFLVRRAVCASDTRNYNRFFLASLVAMRKAPSIDVGFVINLLNSDAQTTKWPGNDEFENAWLHKPIYSRTGHRAAMILEAIDLEMVTSKQEKIHLGESLTVEHVLPQSWKEHWPLGAQTETEEETAEDRRNRLLNTLGNLTLLTQALNTSVSNGPYANKRAEIAAQSSLRLNTYFQTAGTWDEDAILHRGAELFKYAVKIWPAPTALLA